MIFTAEAKELAAAIAVAGRVVPQKSPWPILTNVKIVSNDSKVTLIGSDGDTTLEIDIPADVQTEGAACIPFQPLAKFCSAAKSTQITVAVDDLGAKISAGRSRIGLSLDSVDAYPNYMPPDGEIAEIDGPTFVQALRFSSAAAGDDEVRYHIAGSNFSERDGEIHIWGTDGKSAHHAVIRELDCIGGGATLPNAATQVILSAAEKADTVRFMICDRGWQLSAGTMRLWGKVIDGSANSYPDMDRVVGQFTGWETLFTATRDDLASAINVAMVGTEKDSDKARNIVLYVAPDAPVVMRGFKFSSGVMQAGTSELEAQGKAEFAAPISAKYLSAALGGMKCDDFAIMGSDSDRGISGLQVRPAQESVTLSLSATVMAMRATEEDMQIAAIRQSLGAAA